MAVIRRKDRREGSPVSVLMAAALALPGVTSSAARAGEDDEFTISYGRYVEGERELYDTESAYDPLEAETLLARWRVTLRDRLHLAFAYLEDTWSGATPIATGPLVMGGNAPPPDGLTGATPFINGDLYLDGDLTPLEVDAFGQVIGRDDRLVHILSSASPETRQQVSGNVGYEWDEARVDAGGGYSYEEDYQSGFADLRGRLDLDEKRTQLELGVGYTHSEIDARLDHDAVPYIDLGGFEDSIRTSARTGLQTLREDRDDVAVEARATQVVNRNAYLEVGAEYGYATGYQANPYKVVLVAFIDPEQQFLAPPGGYFAQVRALLERRPEDRHTGNLAARWVQFVPWFEASARLGYRYHLDDWGTDAHTFEASWVQPLFDRFTVIPRVRYYSQSAADFYVPYLVSGQAYQTVVSDPDTGDVVSITPFDAALLPSHYSSDYRLSAFGALSGGVEVSARLGRGVSLAGDFEYYVHQGDLKLGGDGEAGFADFDAYRFSASLVFDSSVLAGGEGRGEALLHHGNPAPAGVMMVHRLTEPGSFMVGVHYGYGRSDGDVLRGSGSAGDDEILADGCEGSPCRTVASDMAMSHTVLELMWAPTSWLNLMVAPRFVNHTMDLRGVSGGEPDIHNSHGHTTGGIGDTTLAALLPLFSLHGQRAHVGLGLSAPTGDVGQEFRRTHQIDRGRLHYAMQLGSGTWDFLPSLTYLGDIGRFSWGAQASGAVRLEDQNQSGYALGNSYQVTGWAGFALTSWLSATGRVLYLDEGDIRSEYDHPHDDAGPMDFPENTGGRFWDAGIGLTVRIPSGRFAGNRLGLEWLQPFAQHTNGFQLERMGALTAIWSVDF